MKGFPKMMMLQSNKSKKHKINAMSGLSGKTRSKTALEGAMHKNYMNQHLNLERPQASVTGFQHQNTPHNVSDSPNKLG